MGASLARRLLDGPQAIQHCDACLPGTPSGDIGADPAADLRERHSCAPVLERRESPLGEVEHPQQDLHGELGRVPVNVSDSAKADDEYLVFLEDTHCSIL